MMKIMNKEPISKYTSKHVLRPIDLDDDEDIEKAIRESADTVYHPVGTCKMGSDEMAVVDSNLKVHKVEGSRVVDASIMRSIGYFLGYLKEFLSFFLIQSLVSVDWHN